MSKLILKNNESIYFNSLNKQTNNNSNFNELLFYN